MSLFGLLCAGALMWVSALFCPNVALAQPAEASGSARIYILPFEYMDAILIESDGHFGMVDSGESSDSPDGSDSRYPVRSGTTVGQGVEDQVTAFMQSMGVTSENFDFYIGTHPHSDHIGTAGQIISAFKPARIYTPLYDDSMITNPNALWDNQYVYDLLVSAAQEAQEEYGASFIQKFDKGAPVAPEDGSNVGNPHFTLGSAQIDIMNTNGSDALGTFVDANCISLGVKVTAGGATAFLSGDINNLCGAEDALASELGHIDFLKLGHHGFNNSNSIGYIKALSPKFVFQTGRYSTMREELVRALGDWLAVLFERRCRQRRFCGLRSFFIVGWRHDQWRVLHSAFVQRGMGRRNVSPLSRRRARSCFGMGSNRKRLDVVQRRFLELRLPLGAYGRFLVLD